MTNLLLWLSCVLSVACVCKCERPNIVFIMADDLGWNDVGFHSGDVATPNIDALAYHGVILSRHYSQPVCSPSRTALFTGNYPFRYGMQGQPCLAGHPDGLKTGVKLMPEFFSRLGYRSHLIGKWHLGFETPEQLPTRRGFDSFFGFLNGFLGYWDGTHFMQGMVGRDFRRNEEPAWREAYGKYLTDLLTEEAVRVIEDHEGDGGLLLIVSEAAVHATDLPLGREAPPGVTNSTDRGYLRAMVQKLDKAVGDIVWALKNKGLLDNSIVVFISDNGGLTVSPFRQNGASNWPLRGEKKSVHDGGVRTVALAYSPLFQNRSRISDQLFHISDWLPTLYAAAGGSPEELPIIDGVNQWSILSSGGPEKRDTLVVDIDDSNNCEAIIKGRWKLVKTHDANDVQKFTDKYYGESGRWMRYNTSAVERSRVAECLGPVPSNYLQLRGSASLNHACKSSNGPADCHSSHCLFDLEEDPTECSDLARSRQDVVAQLEGILADYKGHLVPNQKKKFDERAWPKYWDDYWSPWLVS